MKPEKVLCCICLPAVLALTVHKTQLLNCTSTIQYDRASPEARSLNKKQANTLSSSTKLAIRTGVIKESHILLNSPPERRLFHDLGLGKGN